VALADELNALRTRKPVTFDHWLAAATEDDRATVLAYLTDHTVPLNGLVETLRGNGVPMTRETVMKYRKGTA